MSHDVQSQTQSLFPDSGGQIKVSGGEVHFPKVAHIILTYILRAALSYMVMQENLREVACISGDQDPNENQAFHYQVRIGEQIVDYS